MPEFPDKDHVRNMADGTETIKKLIFTFKFQESYSSLPFSIETDPPLKDLDDKIILLTISSLIRTLTTRHGLEQALQMTNEIAYGRLDGKQAFKMLRMSFDDDDEPEFDEEERL